MALGPLAGFTVGITADRRAHEQAELLERRGARTVHGPVIRTLPLADEAALRAATEALIERPPDATMLVTGLGTRGWFAAAESQGRGEELHAALSPSTVYARGPKAAGAALTAGLEVAWKAPGSRTTEVIERLARDRRAGRLPGDRLALQLDGSSDTWIQDRLTDHGFHVVEVPVYRWTRPLDEQPATRLVHAVADGTVDAVTFTAGPAVSNFFALCGEEGRTADVLEACNSGRVAPVCVGPVCAERARSYGLTTAVEPVHPRLGAMVQACVGAFAERTRVLDLAGHRVEVQGRSIVIDGSTPLNLPDRERDVFDALARRPGAVHAKAALLATVWGDTESDEHVVEVTMARLRRRLGPAGAAIETVVRRGYRLAADPG